MTWDYVGILYWLFVSLVILECYPYLQHLSSDSLYLNYE